jgi:predicted anti-sigma-YlaC factor YlaD
MSTPCPELEVLFNELAEGHGPALDHSKTCPACAAVLAEHAELEKDLFRLQDPFPPANFVPQVMAKVAAAPVPSSVELKTGFAILGSALALAFILVVARGATAGQLGISVAHWVVEGRAILLALMRGVAMAWKTAAIPLAATLAFLLALSLVGLKKLAGTDVPAKV